MGNNLPLKLDVATGRRMAAALGDAVTATMSRLWVSEGGVRGQIDESVFRAECGFILRRLGDRELDHAFPDGAPSASAVVVVPMPEPEQAEGAVAELGLAQGTPTTSNGVREP